MTSSVTEQAQPVEITRDKILPVDTLAEAGHKILLAEFDRLVQLTTGSDIPDIDNLGDAILRMRGAVKLLKHHYKPKTLRLYRHALRHLSQALDNIRALDTLIADLSEFGAGLDAESQAALQQMLDKLAQRQAAAREELATALSSKEQQRFVKALTEDTGTPVEATESTDKAAPSQVRHLLPGLVYDRLAGIRAYDEALAEANGTLLQELRPRFNRLVNTLALFEAVPGKQITDFVDELQEIQSTLNRLHANSSALTRLDSLINTGKKKYVVIVEGYHKYRDDREQALIAEFKERWSKFNSRKVQQKLSTALLALYDN